MVNHGTASQVPGWYIEFQVAVLRNLPRPGDIKKDVATGWSDNGQSLSRALREALVPSTELKVGSAPVPTSTATPVPPDDECFDLEVDYDVDSLDVVCSASYNPEGWKFLGPARKGKMMERVKLVRLGYVRNLAEAEAKADAIGYRLVGGHGREPFKTKYPKPDGKGSVIFGGSQWQNPYGYPHVTCLGVLDGDWDSYVGWADDNFNEGYRWAVVSK